MDDIEGLVPLSDGEDLPVAPERPEESMDWVIETYRKHSLNKVTAWLNENLGKGRGKKTLIPRVLLDVNPIEHRQSLLVVKGECSCLLAFFYSCHWHQFRLYRYLQYLHTQ